MEKTKNALSITSLSLALGNIILFIVLANIKMELTMILLICLLVCIAAFITGIIGVVQTNKNENESGKGMAIAGIVLGLLGTFFFGMGYAGLKLLNDPEYSKQFCTYEQFVNNCEDKEDGTTKCLYAESVEITCDKEELKPEQYKK